MGTVLHDSVTVELPSSASGKENGYVSPSDSDPMELDAGALFVLKSKGKSSSTT